MFHIENPTTKSNQQIFLDHLLKSLPYFIFWKDKNLVYLGANENFAKLVNRDVKNLIGLSDYDLNWGPGEADFYREADRKVMNGINQVNCEKTLAHPDGREIVMLVSKAPVINENGDVIGVLGISTDITKAKQTEKELVQAKKEADDAVQAMRIFASSIAHELRTPLASMSAYMHGIKNYLPLLTQGYQLAEEARLPITKIRNNHFRSLLDIGGNMEGEIHYASTMINMLLMKANPTAIRSAQLSICSIEKCIEQAITRYPFKSAKESSLVNWQKGNDFLFNGNELFVIHILFNLIKNALFQIEAVGKGEIAIWIEHNERSNILNFKDTGKGMSQEKLLKIFDLYFSDTPHGAGIGLAYCKLVMQSFAGNIVCRSEEGKYTHFILTFPCEQMLDNYGEKS